MDQQLIIEVSMLIDKTANGPGMGVDNGFETGNEIRPYCDSMLAKATA